MQHLQCCDASWHLSLQSRVFASFTTSFYLDAKLADMTVLKHHHPFVLQMEAKLLPLFQAALPALAQAAPQVLASVFAFSTGTQESFFDYRFGISCLFDQVSDDQPCELLLLVTLSGLDDAARLDASVRWGQPSGHCEAQAAPMDASMPALLAALPALLAAMQSAVARGEPAATAATASI